MLPIFQSAFPPAKAQSVSIPSGSQKRAIRSARYQHRGENMNEIAGWIAPVATMLVAMMTAANLGARITGTGFAIFTLGSVYWWIMGLTSGQTNLLATNCFLTVVNLFGVWRWLGRQRAYEMAGNRQRSPAATHSPPHCSPRRV